MKLKTALISVCLLFSMNSHAELDITITSGLDGAMPIAITNFATKGKLSQDVDEIIKANLARSGRFKPLAESKFPQKNITPQNMQLRLWREKGIDYLVVGSVEQPSAGSYIVKFQLFDSAGVKQLAGYSIPADDKTLRMAAHQASDLIYEAIIGVRGAFNTRIVYVTKGKPGPRRYVMQISDSDGHNARTILSSPAPLMSPVWSKDNKKIAFVSFENNRSGVYVQDITTGQRTRVSGYKGINGAPAWSPDGRRLAITLSKGGNPDIYVIDLGNKQISQLTRDNAIDTEPVWMPDGTGVAFTSNRSGKPQIYRVSVTGGKPQRLTYEGDYNAAADISPDGSMMTMVNEENGKFRIAVFDFNKGETRVLTDGGLDESPSFAPNGSMIIYATRVKGRNVLAAVSSDGRVKQTLRLKSGGVQEPDWSGFINN